MRKRSFTAMLAMSLFAAAQQTQPQPATAPPQTAAPHKSVVPDKFTNLKVLPADITKPELVKIMKSFAINMKVRCNHCHVAADDLSSADFASDEKPEKDQFRPIMQELFEFQHDRDTKAATLPQPTAPPSY